MKQKNLNAALFLSILLPGAGFAYLGRWKLAALNLALALGVGLLLTLLLPAGLLGRIGTWLPFAIGMASGTWAQWEGHKMNEAAAAEPTLEGVGEEARLS
jgi:hypothetical protein